jgi:hypothetical protein
MPVAHSASAKVCVQLVGTLSPRPRRSWLKATAMVAGPVAVAGAGAGAVPSG